MGRLFDIFVLIFCNSTASRLIYAYSHYNMCAGGGCMYQISNEKFGLFVTELRKKKNLTQKDLAEKLYVSDKTVSKWERGLSMPNVVLLIPIADAMQGLGDHITPLISSGLEMAGKIVIAATLVPWLGYMGVIICEPIVWFIMVIPLLIQTFRMPVLRTEKTDGKI